MNEVKKLVQTGIFLAITSIIVLIQIPIPGTVFLRIDFSLVFILFVERYIGFWRNLIICIFSPIIIIFVYGDLIGMIFLIFLNILILTLHKMFYTNDNLFKKVISSTTIILISILIVIAANLLVFYPAYYGFDYSAIFENLWFFVWLIFAFNAFKLVIIYIFFIIIDSNFKKQEIN